MVKRLKFFFTTISFVLMVSLLSCCVSGCLIKDFEIFEDGLFRYIVVGENSRIPNGHSKAVIAIVGFTEFGKEQEVIEIPREIDGKTVQYIGYKDALRNTDYWVHSENLRKIYIQDNIVFIRFFVGDEVNLMFCSVNEEFGHYLSNFKSVYTYATMINNVNDKIAASTANIEFVNNYSNEENGGYYWLDNIDSGETIPVPPKPERKGYEFIGWYTEPECINVWDFDLSPNIKENTVFKLYAKWRALLKKG